MEALVLRLERLVFQEGRVRGGASGRPFILRLAHTAYQLTLVAGLHAPMTRAR